VRFADVAADTWSHIASSVMARRVRNRHWRRSGPA
jgi:hypothetical protein